jgi:alanine racemase
VKANFMSDQESVDKPVIRRNNAWLELDFDVLCRNVGAMRAVLKPSTEIILVVKANAYGHGLTEVAAKAFGCGVRWFLVARMDEALALRAELPDATILLLGAVWAQDIPVILDRRIIPVIVCEDQANDLAACARKAGVTIPCHVKIDTGMGRFGLPCERAPEILEGLHRAGGFEIQGISMHFSSAGKAGDAFVGVQAERFQRVVAGCRERGMEGLFKHVANSAAFVGHPEWDMDGVRVGILAYGYGGSRSDSRVQTLPFLQWKTRVLQVRKVPAGFPVGYLSTYVTPEPTSLATIDVGYSDGLSRLMSNKGYVLIGGRRAKVVGRVTMNFTTVDVGDQGDVRVGDEVVLIGTQGAETLWADELARWCQTIPYEILTSIRSEPRTRSC